MRTERARREAPGKGDYMYVTPTVCKVLEQNLTESKPTMQRGLLVSRLFFFFLS